MAQLAQDKAGSGMCVARLLQVLDNPFAKTNGQETRGSGVKLPVW